MGKQEKALATAITLKACFTLVFSNPALYINPQQNMWLTFANVTGEQSFCLSMASPSDPFRTCLIGVPLTNFAEFVGWVGKEGEKYVKLSNNQAEDEWCNIKTKRGLQVSVCNGNNQI